jgi:hypothetical protein
MKYTIGFLLILAFATPALAETEFCRGFELGYKTVKGNMVLVPLCPLEPLTPLGSTAFQEGIKAGMQVANE